MLLLGKWPKCPMASGARIARVHAFVHAWALGRAAGVLSPKALHVHESDLGLKSHGARAGTAHDGVADLGVAQLVELFAGVLLFDVEPKSSCEWRASRGVGAKDLRLRWVCPYVRVGTLNFGSVGVKRARTGRRAASELHAFVGEGRCRDRSDAADGERQ